MNTYDDLYDKILIIKKEDFNDEYVKLSNFYDLQILKFIFLHTHNFIINEDIYKEQIIRKLQKKFRKELMELYNSSCVISKVSKFQACHIIPYSNSDTNNKYNIYNGLLLRADLHELFDEYIMTINPNTCEVIFNEDFFNNLNNKNEYEKFSNIKLNLPNNPELTKNLIQHYNIFLHKMKNNI